MHTKLTFTSVHEIPGTNKSAAFTPKTSEVFKEEHDIAPVFINDRMKYIPWGADNNMPYNIIDLIESDETLATCQMFNAEVCYGSGLIYNTEDGSRIVRLARKQACYVRFAPADKNGIIPYVLYANWRNTVSPDDIERIELLNPQSPLSDL